VVACISSREALAPDPVAITIQYKLMYPAPARYPSVANRGADMYLCSSRYFLPFNLIY